MPPSVYVYFLESRYSIAADEQKTTSSIRKNAFGTDAENFMFRWDLSGAAMYNSGRIARSGKRLISTNPTMLSSRAYERLTCPGNPSCFSSR